MSRTCLVIQEARLGDLIQSKPLLDDLSAAGFRTVVLVRPGVAEAARALSLGDEVLSWSSFGDPGSDQTLVSRLSGAKEFMRSLREKRVDRVIVLNHHGTGILLSRLLNVPVSGFTKMFDPSELEAPPVFLGGWPGYLVASSRGIRALNRVHLSDMWRGFTDDLPRSLSIRQVRRIHNDGPVVVVLGGRSPYRRLEPEALLGLIKELKRIDGKEILLIGGSDDASLGALLEKDAGNGVFSLAGKTDFRALSDLLSHAGVVVSPDTAPLHLAASLGVPTVGLFFASALSEETGAYAEGALSVVTKMGCYPCPGEGASCLHRSCRDSPGADVLALIVSAVRRGANGKDLVSSLEGKLEGVDLLEGVRTQSGFLQRVLTPRLLTRERLLARLLRRFYWRYLNGVADLPSLAEEISMEGMKGREGFAPTTEGRPPDPLWMVRLEQGVTLYARLREQDLQGPQRRRMIDRLASEFPMIWPILHHLEWVEGGQGGVQSLVGAAEALVREIPEAVSIAIPFVGRMTHDKERAHVAI